MQKDTAILLSVLLMDEITVLGEKQTDLPQATDKLNQTKLCF
jgi:hypothetical protein